MEVKVWCAVQGRVCKANFSAPIYEQNVRVTDVLVVNGNVYLSREYLKPVDTFEFSGATKARYFPYDLEKFFPNLKTIVLQRGLLDKIQQRDLREHKFLEELNLANNDLEILQKDLFKYNRKLKSINLNNNRIGVIHPNVFDDLRLDYLGMQGSQCIHGDYANPAAVERAKQELKEKCRSCPFADTPIAEIKTSIDDLEKEFKEKMEEAKKAIKEKVVSCPDIPKTGIKSSIDDIKSQAIEMSNKTTQNFNDLNRKLDDISLAVNNEPEKKPTASPVIGAGAFKASDDKATIIALIIIILLQILHLVVYCMRVRRKIPSNIEVIPRQTSRYERFDERPPQDPVATSTRPNQTETMTTEVPNYSPPAKPFRLPPPVPVVKNDPAEPSSSAKNVKYNVDEDYLEIDMILKEMTAESSGSKPGV